MLFPAFRQNGYAVHALAASCVDWMGLKETVFNGVSSLETWCHPAAGENPDSEMLARARQILHEGSREQPLFLFLFFDGTHFSYQRDPQDQVFLPEWNGEGSIGALGVAPSLIAHRARNAARKVDRTLDQFVSEVERARGRAPLVLFTGDDGEEFRQKGHLGHASDVTDEQIHVPAAIFGPMVPRGVLGAPTSHVDVTPTLLALLGERHSPALYSEGREMFDAPKDWFVTATVGWEPRYAVIGSDLKVRLFGGLGSIDVTAPDDSPLADGPAKLSASTRKIWAALRGNALEDKAGESVRFAGGVSQ